MMWGSVPLVDGHLIDGDDVAMGNVLRETSLRSCSREEAMKTSTVVELAWSGFVGRVF